MKHADSELGDRTREPVIPQALQETAALRAAKETKPKAAKKTTKKAASRKR